LVNLPRLSSWVKQGGQFVWGEPQKRRFWGKGSAAIVFHRAKNAARTTSWMGEHSNGTGTNPYGRPGVMKWNMHAAWWGRRVESRGGNNGTVP